ncbi:MAG: M48 family metalloprotease [Rhodospirillales bacterium]|jgi:predicted Zn-dependent protease|nr:M48 family metalloprotease [Rhodospirillaceae bacterium]MBT5036556.1 M48 family metalloprotease [Rhodospirillaceae bacterium]MBT6220047.1 M48 family metalloprotease [Rhodospirillaceae bacterium]MBT6361164.1 M48 family metalloprotease [Rhodospirillaceae bacterium]MBT8001452.1 M48 family metalloprotease [Rhodospirillales bacterium]
MMKRYFVLLILIALPILSGCTQNPATGKQDFTAFMTPEDEVRVGKEEHPKILKQHGGVYDEFKLGRYVSEVSFRLTQVAELPNLTYTITILNDTGVNAFALPGGYIYVTRGLLSLVENEAEMAGVLAHEIGHVTARHTAQRYSKAIATNLGLNVVGILGSLYGAPAGAGNVLSLGAALYLQGHSREQELEADKLAVRYLVRAGYDPKAMVTFFKKMQAHSHLQAKLAGKTDEPDQFHALSTHPRTEQRIVQAINLVKLARLKSPRLGRTQLLAALDGMLYGDDPKQGVRRGRDFIHPGLRLKFRVPPGFVMVNTPTQVIARGPMGSVIVFDSEKSAEVARSYRNLSVYLTEKWASRLDLRGVENISINGLAAATGGNRLQLQAGVRDARLVAMRERPDVIYRFVFLTPPNRTGALSTELRRTTYSFQRISEREARNLRPLRISVVTVRRGDTVESLAARLPVERFRLELFEALNGITRGQRLRPGQKVKLISG